MPVHVESKSSWSIMESYELFLSLLTLLNKLRCNFSWKLQQYQRDHDKIYDIPPVCANNLSTPTYTYFFSLLYLQVSPLLSEHNIVIWLKEIKFFVLHTTVFALTVHKKTSIINVIQFIFNSNIWSPLRSIKNEGKHTLVIPVILKDKNVPLFVYWLLNLFREIILYSLNTHDAWADYDSNLRL